MLEKILHMRLDLFTIIKKKKERGIFGTASSEELKELKEEGIETEMVPWVEDKN